MIDYPIQLVVKGTNGKVMPLLSVAEAFKEFHHTIDKAYTSTYWNIKWLKVILKYKYCTKGGTL
jgi:hypothetical protein